MTKVICVLSNAHRHRPKCPSSHLTLPGCESSELILTDADIPHRTNICCTSFLILQRCHSTQRAKAVLQNKTAFLRPEGKTVFESCHLRSLYMPADRSIPTKSSVMLDWRFYGYISFQSFNRHLCDRLPDRRTETRRILQCRTWHGAMILATPLSIV